MALDVTVHGVAARADFSAACEGDSPIFSACGRRLMGQIALRAAKIGTVPCERLPLDPYNRYLGVSQPRNLCELLGISAFEEDRETTGTAVGECKARLGENSNPGNVEFDRIVDEVSEAKDHLLDPHRKV